MRPKEIESTNELRVTGTKNLLGAAIANGVRRYVAESMIFGYGYGNNKGMKTEDDPFPVPAPTQATAPALDALGYLEKAVLGAAARNEIEGIALRFGIFYGPGVGSTEFAMKLLRRRLMLLPGGGKGIISWIHIEDAASATVAALESNISGEVFNVVDDRPASFAEHFGGIAEAQGLRPPGRLPEFIARLGGSYTAQMARTNLKVANQKIKDGLGWAPRYPSFEEGARTLAPA
jgi:nucleoside-diphosphate-sugar epimerase